MPLSSSIQDTLNRNKKAEGEVIQGKESVVTFKYYLKEISLSHFNRVNA